MTYQKHTYMYEIKGRPLRYKPLFYHSNMDHPDPSDEGFTHQSLSVLDFDIFGTINIPGKVRYLKMYLMYLIL